MVQGLTGAPVKDATFMVSFACRRRRVRMSISPRIFFSTCSKDQSTLQYGMTRAR